MTRSSLAPALCVVWTLGIILSASLTPGIQAQGAATNSPRGQGGTNPQQELQSVTSFSAGWGAHFRASFQSAAARDLLKRQGAAMRALRVAYDNDGLWDWGEPSKEGPEVLHKMLDQYADSGAGFIVWGCGNNLAWGYTPKVQEAWCERLPGKVVRQSPSLAKLQSLQRSYLAAGTDPLSHVLVRARQRGLAVLAGFRINRFMSEHGVESWYEKNPKLFLSKESCPFYAHTRSGNLALPEVREHFVKNSIDVVERYPDVDGLHFEFVRALPFFEKAEPNKIEHMTAFLRMLRKELDRIGRERGKRLLLSVMIPTPEFFRVCRPTWPPEFFDLAKQGLDPEAWIREKLVDVLIPCVYTVHLPMPQAVDLRPWVKMAQGSATRVYGGVFNITAKMTPKECQRTVEVMNLVAAQSEGVFVFNSQPAQLAAVLDRAAAEPLKVTSQ